MSRLVARWVLSCAVLGCVLIAPGQARAAAGEKPDSSASPAYRFERGGWTYVHLEGTPAEIGYQHGRLLAPEIADLVRVSKVELAHSTKHKWEYFRETGKTALWPHIEAEYREELEGIVKGLQSKGVKLDLWDVVALNGTIELSEYYLPWLKKNAKAESVPHILPRGRCSAFIATGSYTKDGKIVIAHNNWTSYPTGERWTIIFDVVPKKGHRFVMDGEPGVITSEDDFGVNDAGLMITETTITQFIGWDPAGIPEFVRSRKAMQYAGTIDEYIAIMKEGNNGGYANDWLIGDRNTGEIAYLELGLKNTPVWRKKDGYFISSNFARDPQLIKDETEGFDPTNLSSSPNARRVTWEDKMAAAKGQIDLGLAEQFLGNHDDSYTGKNEPSGRTLCGHIENDPKGVPVWEDPPFFPDGAVTGKVTDSTLAERLAIITRAGHPCGQDFLAEPFLKAHPEFAYMKPILRDMKAGPWTPFYAGQKP